MSPNGQQKLFVICLRWGRGIREEVKAIGHFQFWSISWHFFYWILKWSMCARVHFVVASRSLHGIWERNFILSNRRPPQGVWVMCFPCFRLASDLKLYICLRGIGGDKFKGKKIILISWEHEIEGLGCENHISFFQASKNILFSLEMSNFSFIYFWLDNLKVF